MSGPNSEILKRLLPKGPYVPEDGTPLAGDLAAQGAGADLAEGDVALLLENLFADTAEALLSSWERVYGVESSGGSAAEPIEIRRQRVLMLMRQHPGLSIPFLQAALTPLLGAPPKIVEYRPSGADPPEYIYQFWVEPEPGSVTVPISYNVLNAAIDLLKPAHTRGWFVLHLFLFDDPDSLMDDDPLTL